MRLLFMFLAAVAALTARAGLTIEHCIEEAEKNYPVLAKYDIVNSTAAINLSDINKGWLPRIGVYAQGTLQNDVPSWPDALSDMLAAMGREFGGMKRLQYKAGVDLTQTIWDGGASRAARAVRRASADVEKASLDVEMYAVKERVQNIFFAILLMERQIEQTRETLALLEANHARVKAMVENGTAMKSDAAMIEAQVLSVSQQISEATNTAASYRKMLAIYTGLDTDRAELELPSAEIPADHSADARPELKLLDLRSRLNNALLDKQDVSLMPRVGLFAQAYYGYPGLNYFESMMNRNLSFNIVGGLKVSWNIDSFYTRKNFRRTTALDNESLRADRDLFLFNTSLATTQQRQRIDALREVIESDSRIVALRTEVRTAAESQLRNGVVDLTALLGKITDENVARLAARYHEIQLIQQIYQLKYTLNR